MKVKRTEPQPPSTSKWQSLKDHLPIMLVIGGLAAFLVGLHMAATALIVLAALHLVFGTILVFLTRRSGNSKRFNWLRSREQAKND